MCTFITLTVNAEADAALVTATARSLGIGLRIIHAPPGISPKRRYLAHETAICDCGTAIGTGWREDKPSYTTDEIAKLRKKGWSRAKIERWKVQRLTAEGKDERADESRLTAARSELASWVGLAHALLDAPTVTAVGLMHDNYSSGPESPDYPLVVAPNESIADLNEERLFRLPAGTLVEWTA